MSLNSNSDHEVNRDLSSIDEAESLKSDERTVNDFSCNIFLGKHICLDAKRKKKQQLAIARRKNMLRLEQLSEPKRIFYEASPEKSDARSLKKLLPRLCQLAKPKRVTQKYIKPKEQPFPLPGCVKDWEAHKKWLQLRARPKRSFSKITCDGIRRISLLTRPRTRTQCCHQRKRFVRTPERSCRCTSSHDEPSKSVKVSRSPSVISYRASERIKSESLAKYVNLKIDDNEGSQRISKCPCKSRSISSYVDILLKESFLDTNEHVIINTKKKNNK